MKGQNYNTFFSSETITNSFCSQIVLESGRKKVTNCEYDIISWIIKKAKKKKKDNNYFFFKFSFDISSFLSFIQPEKVG